MTSLKSNYGIDAPHIVRNLFFFSLILLITSILSFQIQRPLWFWLVFFYSFSTFLTLFGAGCWMLYGIKIAKPKIVTQMIQNLHLVGDEKILDLGCGRGLALCESAKYLSQGEAHGIDLWSTKDQSGNKPETTLENATYEGVRDKVTIHTGDITELPFPDKMYDAIVSSLCLHNIEDKSGREKALLEMLRVLKPGGKFAIADIQYSKEYQKFLMAQGAIVKASKPNYSYCPPMVIIEGTK